MKELAGRLTALDPDAGAAVRVIAYFDRLAESRAGVEALVRGAAVLAGCPARLVDPERRVHVRVEPDGTRRDTETPPHPTWPSARLSPDRAAILWLERGGAETGGGDAKRAGASLGEGITERTGTSSGGVLAGRTGAAPDEAIAGHTRATPGIVGTEHTEAEPSTLDAEHTGTKPARVVSGTDRGRARRRPRQAYGGWRVQHGRRQAHHPNHAQRDRRETRRSHAPQAGRKAQRGLTQHSQRRAHRSHTSTVNAEHTAPTPSTVNAETAAAAPSVVDAVILERAAGALRLVLDRTRGRAPADDPALVETLLDATAPEQARLHAARRLGLDPTAPARALAPLNDRPRVMSAGPEGAPRGGPGVAESSLAAGWSRTAVARAAAADGPRLPGAADTDTTAVAALGRATAERQGIRTGAATPPRGSDPAQPATGRTTPRAWTGRLGVGPAVPVLELPRSWAAARTALRFTAEGTSQDPGPRIVYADELGGIALLADLVVPGAEPPPDVRALETAAATTPWLLATLHAVASTASLRAAATGINVHHSTLQDRLAHAEHLLGWPVRTPQGRLRLQLALAMRHLARP